MNRPILPVLALLLALSCPLSPSAAQTPAPVELRILAINDFHGYLRPPPGGIRIADPTDKTKKVMVSAGGSESLASVVASWRQGHRNTICVAAGELIGPNPLLSVSLHGESLR